MTAVFALNNVDPEKKKEFPKFIVHRLSQQRADCDPIHSDTSFQTVDMLIKMPAMRIAQGKSNLLILVYLLLLCLFICISLSFLFNFCCYSSIVVIRVSYILLWSGLRAPVPAKKKKILAQGGKCLFRGGATTFLPLHLLFPPVLIDLAHALVIRHVGTPWWKKQNNRNYFPFLSERLRDFKVGDDGLSNRKEKDIKTRRRKRMVIAPMFSFVSSTSARVADGQWVHLLIRFYFRLLN